MDYANIPRDMNLPGMLTKNNSMRALAVQYSLPADFRTSGAYHNNPTPADKGKPMYYSNGFFIGHFQGLENYAGGPRASYSRNEEKLTQDAWNPQTVYVQNAPLVADGDGGGGSVAGVSRGGKSRRRHSKKTRRGKSKSRRRGRKSRGQRRR